MSTTTVIDLATWRREYAGREQRWELADGIPVMVPAETPRNLDAAAALYDTLRRHCHQRDWLIVAAADLVIRAESPATARKPDLLLARRRGDGRRAVDPADVGLVVEVLSDSTAHVDTDRKRRDYASIAVPNYLILDVRGAAPALRLFTGDGGDTGWTDQVVLAIGEHSIPVSAHDLAWHR